MKMQLKRIVSAVCAVALCASVVTTPVLAINGDDTSVPGTTQSESSASEGTQVETPAPAEPTVNNGQPEDTTPVEPENTQEEPADTEADIVTDGDQPASGTNDVPEEPGMADLSGEVSTFSLGDGSDSNDVSELSYFGNTYVWNVASIEPNSGDSDGYKLTEASGDVNKAENVKVYVSDNKDNDNSWTQIDASDGYYYGMPAPSERHTERYVKVVAEDGYYIQYLVVACNDNTHGNYDGLDCKSVGNGSAYTTAKDVGTNEVVLDTQTSGFYHKGMGSPYHILIQLAESPNPVYVVYDAGIAASAFGNRQVVSTAGAEADTFDTSGTSVAFQYPYNGQTPSIDALKPTLPTVSMNGKFYEFDGWDVTYYTDDVTTFDQAFAMSSPSNMNKGTVAANETGDGQPDVVLSTHVKLVAQWSETDQPVISSVSVTKKVTDASGTEITSANVGDTVTYTITVKNTGNTALSNLTVTDTFEGVNEPQSLTGGLAWEKKQESGEVTYKYVGSATITSLAVSGEETFTYTYTIPAADEGRTISNTVVVTGTDIEESKDEASVQVAVGETTGPAGDVEINKTADPKVLVDNEADVTLSVGGTQEELEAYVLFVLDKSTSTDVRNEAAAMLNELMTQVDTGYSINVGVISFEREVDDLLDGWVNLNADNYSEIVEALNTKRNESGTNIYLGLREAKSMMDALTEVDAAYKHIVLVTDGITYLWSNSENTDDTQLYSIYSESISNGEESINAGMDMIAAHHPNDYAAFVSEFADMKTWMQNYGSAIAQDIETYQHVYNLGQYKADTPNQQANSTYVNAGFSEGDYIPGEDLASHYSANEAAVYMATTVWQDIVEAGYHAYAYADVTGENNSAGNNVNAKNNPWAANFICGLGTIGGKTGRVTTDSVDGMFDDVKSSIIYAIDRGTVTDVIGDDFDLKAVDSFELTVGGVTLTEKTVDGSTVKFGTASDGEYPYVVTYYPNGVNGDTREQFVWQINTPVESTAGLQLTYKVELVNVPTAIGEHKLPTNEEATLDYTSTNGGTGHEEFPKPEVTYNVVGVTPASLTIYMGGSSGYGNIVDDTGHVNVSLPEPGFYLELTEEMNKELRAVLGKESTDIIDLSDYVTLTAGDNEWTLKRYGYTADGTVANENTSAGYIEDQNRFIYKIVPVQGGTPVRVKVSKNNEIKTDDGFEIQDKLYEEYTMEIYGEGIDAADLKLSINIPAKDRADGVQTDYTTSSGLVGGDPATLTVRYVTGEQDNVVTDALTDISDSHDSDKAYVVLQDLEGNKAEHFIINEAVEGTAGKTLTVQADPGSVDLLFDDIVSADDTNDNETKFEETLVDNAVEATDHTFQNLQYQAKYLDLVDANNGNAWLTIAEGEKVTVYWPYPEGTNADTKFYLQHFVGIDRDDTLDAITQEVEEAEPVDVTVYTDANGIRFETDSFSPYVLLWDKTTPAVDDGGKEETSTPASTPSPTAAPAKATQPVAAVIPQTGDDSQPILWVALVGISGVALAALAVYRKKRSDK